MSEDQAVLLMADMFVRTVTLKLIDVAIWMPCLGVLAFLHAKWSRKG